MNNLRKFKLLSMLVIFVISFIGCANYAKPTALQRELIPPPKDSKFIVELRPDVIQILNGMKQLIADPNMLLDRQLTLSKFDTQVIRARKIVRSDSSIVTEDIFTATKGLFSNVAWSGGYNFRQLEPCITGCKNFLVQVEIFVNHKNECVSSKAVHSYLNISLQLQQSLRGTGSETNIYEKGDFKLISQEKNAGLEIAFIDGCLNFLSLSNLFNYMEHSDANVFYK